ncbi:cell division control protein 48 (nucleomorph) [Chroomonas mesostigmatica CCMP1168]|uniref:Cell division control protein 48 n=1 Tax=Chroomonas mesostigmatica CCMP1168 TaxID=1195612 RepID=J7G7Q4_9CRYP|nr:cell division control protein 48 [Chroomonas mesostigmatica CCMP1168]
MNLVKEETYFHFIFNIKFFQLSLLSQMPFYLRENLVFHLVNQNFFYLRQCQMIDLHKIDSNKFFLFYYNSNKKKVEKKKIFVKKMLNQKKYQKNFFIEKNFKTQSFLRYRDFAGINYFIKNIQELIEWPLKYSSFYKKLGISPTRGILFNGPPGTGKTLLANVIAGELKLPFFCIFPSSLASSFSGQSEKKIQEIFYFAKKCSPSIIFIDEIDTVIGSRENTNKETDKKIIGQLLVCIDKIDDSGTKPVVVLGATNKINSIDPSLRRPGRFDRELEFKAPDFLGRLSILKNFSKTISFDKDINLDYYAEKTFGFVSGDLSGLIITAGMLAISRVGTVSLKGKYRTKNTKFLNKINIKKIDFERAFCQLEPGITRHGFVRSSKIGWKNIGGMNQIRKIMSKYIIEPIKKIVTNTSEKIKGTGILLFGPPGCGKTLIAKAVANESHANFISIKGPEIFDKFLGESEKEIRSIFNKARSCAPTVIFFDEIDSITTKRTNESNNHQNSASERILNQLLTEMDGYDFNESIFIIGATNRPHIIDKAVLRPGRIDKFLLVSLPNEKERVQILETIFSRTFKLPFLELKIFTEKTCSGFSGADLESSVKEGVVNAFEKKILYCRIMANTTSIYTNYFSLLGSKNFLNGIEVVKKNLHSNKMV